MSLENAPAVIETPRLLLIPQSAALAAADLAGRQALADALAAAVPDAWPPELFDDAREHFAKTLSERPDEAGWWAWYWLLREPRTLIGSGGFGGPPDTDGQLILGYAVLPEFQGEGYATEAVQHLTDWALKNPAARQIVADTFPNLVASIRVLQKNLFTESGAGGEPGSVRYRRRSLSQ